jgi:hypothetical protein
MRLIPAGQPEVPHVLPAAADRHGQAPVDHDVHRAFSSTTMLDLSGRQRVDDELGRPSK